MKNKFTKEEIKNAKAVIIAADTKIDLSRFDGKKLIKAKVADGINRPQELIERVLSSDAKIIQAINLKIVIQMKKKDLEQKYTNI